MVADRTKVGFYTAGAPALVGGLGWLARRMRS